jgi:enoyl-CoA hydratase/carnithine racemase
LTGAGNVFTAGNDLADFQSSSAVDEESPVVRFLRKLATTDIPIVAAVNGAAVGIGVTMLLHIDFVHASTDATFSAPFIDLALVPEASSSMLMPMQMGYRKAAAMLMMGERFDAQQALETGLVGEIIEADALLERSREVARRLATKPSQALRSTKRLMRLPAEPILDRIQLEMHEFVAALKSPEAQEAVKAFLEKRKPDFSKFD